MELPAAFFGLKIPSHCGLYTFAPPSDTSPCPVVVGTEDKKTTWACWAHRAGKEVSAHVPPPAPATLGVLSRVEVSEAGEARMLLSKLQAAEP